MRLGFLLLLLVFGAFGAQAETKAQLERQIRAKDARAEILTRQIAKAQKEVGATRARLIALAGEIQALDSARANGEAQLESLAISETILLARLEKSRLALAEILAGLQVLSANPPPAFLVHAEDARAAIQSALLMGEIIPITKAQSAALAAELAELASIRANIAQTQNTLDESARLAEKKHAALARALREKEQREEEARREAQKTKAEIAQLVERARNLRDLSRALKNNKPLISGRANEKAGGGASEYVSAFTKARGRLALPVAGRITSAFGEQDGTGNIRQGLLIGARAGAQITAPYDGVVLYAGPFRQYGHILILGLDTHHQLILAGLAGVAIYVGQSILAGEPLGLLPAPESGGKNNARQQLYMELRYKGKPIDPAPWIVGQLAGR